MVTCVAGLNTYVHVPVEHPKDAPPPICAAIDPLPTIVMVSVWSPAGDTCWMKLFEYVSPDASETVTEMVQLIAVVETLIGAVQVGFLTVVPLKLPCGDGEHNALHE